jgi:acetyltransferase
MRKDLQTLFNPKSIAILGASRSEKKLGFIVLRNIIEGGYEGRVYPVNPNADGIHNLKCFPDYASLPEVPELAIVSLPAEAVIITLKEISLKGTKNVVVFTAGFKEIGEEGKKIEEELINVAKENGLNLLGPNCLGFVNNLSNLNATFGKVAKGVGNLRFISQSGAIATSIFDWSEYNALGFREFITLGNKSVISENDILHFWASHKHDETKHNKFLTALHHEKRISKVNPIGLYLESIIDGEDFLNTVSQITLKDPVFLLKPGKSEGAKKAMQSHTGAIAGEDLVLDTALQQAGVIRCEGIEDMFDLAKVFSLENAPEGPNVAVVSNAGGPAVISADFIEKYGLKLAPITDDTKAQLSKHLPRASSFLNPIDVLGDALASRYAYAIDIVLGQPGVHSMLVILTPQVMTQIYQTAEYIGRLSQVHKKPVICAFMGGTDIEKGEKILNMFKIPSFRFPERAIKALGAMWWWKDCATKRSLQIRKLSKGTSGMISHTAETHRVNQILQVVKRERRDTLNNFESNEILKSWNIKTPPSTRVENVFDALDFITKHGWPVVLKLSSRFIMHKTELGGVIVNINNRSKLEQAFDIMNERIASLDPEVRATAAIQIQKQITGGTEVILGIKKDPTFGHTMLFGAGGTLAEIIEDRNLRLLPVDKFDAQKLVVQSKIYKVLKGFRGDKPYALSQLYFIMEKLSELIEMFPEFSEFEINPLIVTHEDVWAVDGKGIVTYLRK